MKPWHCCYNPLEVIGAGQGGNLPFHLLQWLGSVRVFVSPRGGVQESSLSKAQGGMWWARKSWPGCPEHSLPSLAPRCCRPWYVMCSVVLSLNAHSSGWELFAGLVSEHMGPIQTMGPSVQEPGHC